MSKITSETRMRQRAEFCEHARVSTALESLVIRNTHRLPAPTGPAGQGGVAARQFDAALMSVGFKLSAGLLEHLSALAEESVIEAARRTLPTVRQLTGDHVRHNVYFIDFPAHVPDTFEFWMRRIAEALPRTPPTRAPWPGSAPAWSTC